MFIPSSHCPPYPMIDTRHGGCHTMAQHLEKARPERMDVIFKCARTSATWTGNYGYWFGKWSRKTGGADPVLFYGPRCKGTAFMKRPVCWWEELETTGDLAQNYFSDRFPSTQNEDAFSRRMSAVALKARRVEWDDVELGRRRERRRINCGNWIIYNVFAILKY